VIQEDNRLAINKLIKQLYRNRFLIAGVFVSISLMALLYLKLADTIYKVEASILIDNASNPSFSGEEFLEGFEVQSSQRNVKNEMGVLSSFELINEALATLPLRVAYFTEGMFTDQEHYPEFPYQVEIDTLYFQLSSVPIYVEKLSGRQYRLMIDEAPLTQYHYTHRKTRSFPEQTVSVDTTLNFGQPFIHQHFSFTLWQKDPQTEIDAFYFYLNNMDKMAEEYKSELEINLSDLEASIIQIGLEGTLPYRTIDVMSALCDAYISRDLEKTKIVANNTITFIDDYLAQTTDSLRKAGNKLEDYRRTEDLMDIEMITANAYERMKDMEQQQASLDVNRKYYEYIDRYLAESDAYDAIVSPSAYGVDDPVLTELVLEIKRLDSELAAIQVNSTENNPQMDIIERKITNLINAIRQSVKSNLASVRIAINDNDERMAETRQLLRQLPQQERNLSDIQRQFNLSDNLYNYLMEKKAEAGILKIAKLPGSELLDKPRIVGNEPVAPNKPLVVIMALFFSLIISGLVVMLREHMSSGVNEREQIEAALHYPLLANIGKQKGSLEATLKGEDLYIKNAFKELLVNIELLHEQKPIAVGFTSTISGEGKTFCSTNFAVTCASLGYKTLLLETDVYRPQLSMMFPYAQYLKYFNDYFEKNLPAREIIHQSDLKNLDIIFSKPSKDIHLKGSDHASIKELFDYLKSQYDVIVVDSSPAGLVTDYFALSRFMDLNLFVVRQNYSKMSHIGEIKRIIAKADFKKIGIVFNNVKQSPIARYSNYYKPYQYM
jgi:capsular exopolysaccharide synthesis family protein